MNRIDLQQILEEKLGSRNVYYQAPSKVSYPCIIYDRNDIDTNYANDKIYKKKTHYTLMLITKNADCDDLIDSLLSLDYCSFNRQYISDNLYHCVFDLYY